VRRDDGERGNDDELGDERHPRDTGQPHHRHPGSPQVQDGDDEVEPRGARTETPTDLRPSLPEGSHIRPGGMTLREVRVPNHPAVGRDVQHPA